MNFIFLNIGDTLVSAGILFVICLFIVSAFCIKIVPQDHVFIVERIGTYFRTLTPGLYFIHPMVDKIKYKISLSEQECSFKIPSIFQDNTRIDVNIIFRFKVSDPIMFAYQSNKQNIETLLKNKLTEKLSMINYEAVIHDKINISNELKEELNDDDLKLGIQVNYIELNF